MKIRNHPLFSLLFVSAAFLCATQLRGNMRGEPPMGTGPFHTLRLLNGDLMHGKILQARGTDLEFQPRWSATPVHIGLRFVNYLFLDGQSPKFFEPRAWIQLTNDDRLDGRFLGMDDEWVHWETPWGQKANIKRRMVKTLGVSPGKDEVLMPYAETPDDWSLLHHGRRQARNPTLTMISGEMVLPPGNASTVTRQLPVIPERFVFEFKLKHLDEQFSTTLTLMGQNGLGRSQGSLSLQINQRQVFGQLIRQQSRAGNNWREDLPHHAREEQFFRIFVDFNAETAIVYLNGRRFKAWEISNEENLVGRDDLYFSFRPVQGNGRTLLSQVRMLQWDGETFPHDLESMNRQKDVIFLRNGQAVEGRVLQAGADEWVVATEEDVRRTIPLAEILEYHPPVPLRATPRRRNRDVELRLNGTGNRLTFVLNGFDGEHWHGESAAWSAPLEIPAEWLAFVRYNIYRGEAADAAEISIDLDRSFLESEK